MDVLPSSTYLTERYLLGSAIRISSDYLQYAARDLTTQKEVWIKELFPLGMVVRNNNIVTPIPGTQNSFQQALQRTNLEAALLARFRSVDGIVTLQNIIQTNGTIYIITDPLSGVSLKQSLQQYTSQYSQQDVLRMMHPILKAVAIMHDAGIYHHDIRPENLMLSSDGILTLTGFHAAGSIQNPQDIRNDIFCCCSIVYEMLTGSPLTSQDPKILQKSLSGICPSSWIQAYLKALSAASMHELIALLYSGNTAETRRTTSSNNAKIKRTPSSSGRKFIPIIVSSMAVIITVIIAIFLFQNRSPQGNPMDVYASIGNEQDDGTIWLQTRSHISYYTLDNLEDELEIGNWTTQYEQQRSLAYLEDGSFSITETDDYRNRTTLYDASGNVQSITGSADGETGLAQYTYDGDTQIISIYENDILVERYTTTMDGDRILTQYAENFDSENPSVMEYTYEQTWIYNDDGSYEIKSIEENLDPHFRSTTESISEYDAQGISCKAPQKPHTMMDLGIDLKQLTNIMNKRIVFYKSLPMRMIPNLSALPVMSMSMNTIPMAGFYCGYALILMVIQAQQNIPTIHMETL